MKKETER